MALYIGNDKYVPMIGNTRGKFMIKKLPYDAEIEYLESSGTQYIDIPIDFMPSTDEIYAKFSENTNQNVDKYMISSFPWNTRGNKFGMGIHNSVFTVAFDNITTGSTFLSPETRNDGVFHTWEYSLGTMKITDLNISISDISAQVASNNLRLFYGYNSNTKGKWAYYRHLRDGIIIIDLIPVRIGNVGYMYDKVSKQLFSNNGTGDFILGPDKN